MATEKSVASVKPSKGPARPQTPAQTGGPSPIQKADKYLREVWSELKKANWPSREELKAQTQVVLALLLFLGIFMWVWDSLLGLIFKGLMRLMGVEHGGG
jgi:preprotein translocase subunit SecE